jgi:hypothetical protein
VRYPESIAKLQLKLSQSLAEMLLVGNSETSIARERTSFVAQWKRIACALIATSMIAVLLMGAGCSEKWVTSWGSTVAAQSGPTPNPTPTGLVRLKVAPYEPTF